MVTSNIKMISLVELSTLALACSTRGRLVTINQELILSTRPGAMPKATRTFSFTLPVCLAQAG